MMRACPARSGRKPRWEPSGAVIGPVWAVLYVCTALAASLLWRKREAHDLWGLMGLFALQYLLNYAFTTGSVDVIICVTP
jgi:tryptophan-rich sensory protein